MCCVTIPHKKGSDSALLTRTSDENMSSSNRGDLDFSSAKFPGNRSCRAASVRFSPGKGGRTQTQIHSVGLAQGPQVSQLETWESWNASLRSCPEAQQPGALVSELEKMKGRLHLHYSGCRVKGRALPEAPEPDALPALWAALSPVQWTH